MLERSSKKQARKDPNELAAYTTEAATNESNKKNPHAVALGRLGGKKGGKARAEKLTAEQRLLIAKKAAYTRWNKKLG